MEPQIHPICKSVACYVLIFGALVATGAESARRVGVRHILKLIALFARDIFGRYPVRGPITCPRKPHDPTNCVKNKSQWFIVARHNEFYDDPATKPIIIVQMMVIANLREASDGKSLFANEVRSRKFSNTAP
jgi:hypothetical protein